MITKFTKGTKLPSARLTSREEGRAIMTQRIWAGTIAAIGALVVLHGRADEKQLVYADFENTENNRAVSTRGGMISLWSYEQDKVHVSTFKGAPGVDPPAPELVHIKQGDPNHAAKFDYALQAPNDYAGVAMEIHGLPDAAGKPQTDDVSGFKYLSLQLYATGIRILRIETRTNESGKDTRSVYPQYTLEVKPGLNTYRVPMSGFTQPAWADIRVDPKDVFRKLTSIAVTAFCDQCLQSMQGLVIVDNVVFEK
jgi:hypothetical protein